MTKPEKLSNLKRKIFFILLINIGINYSYSQYDSIIYHKYRYNEYYYSSWLSTQNAYISTCNVSKFDSTIIDHRQLKASKNYYSELAKSIDFKSIYELKDKYPHYSIGSRGTPLIVKITIFYKNKKKTINGELLDLPIEIQEICSKIDTLIHFDYNIWSTINIHQCFFDNIKPKKIIIYKIIADSIDDKGYWELYGRELKNFKNDIKTFIRVDPILMEESYKKNKFMIILGDNLDLFEPYYNVIMTDGEYYKTSSYLWFIDEDFRIKKYLKDTNWRQ